MRQSAVPQPQGSNPGRSLSRCRGTNVAQPQQPMPRAQGQQQFRFRTPMTSSRQGQTGNNTLGNVGAGPGPGELTINFLKRRRC